MPLRVGRIPYLHAEPFYFDMERRGIVLYEMVPSALATALTDGEIAPGQCRWWTVFAWQTACSRLGFLCCHAQKTGSIFLYSTKPMSQLHDARIGITDEASTAARLLDVLLRVQHQVQPAAYVSLQDAYDAFLLIGNDGLRQRGGARGFAYTYDLGQNGMPGPGCRLSSPLGRAPGCGSHRQSTTPGHLYVGLEVGVEALYGITEPREDLLMLPRDITRYIRNFRLLHWDIRTAGSRLVSALPPTARALKHRQAKDQS